MHEERISAPQYRAAYGCIGCISSKVLPFATFGNSGPIMVLLHWLGGCAATWNEVGTGLAARGMTCVALDLPGFGRAPATPDLTMESTVEAVVLTISELLSGHDQPWFLAGHSMGGKFASIVARAALDGHPGLRNLRGVVLVSPSPPGPEPMDEGTRRKLISEFGADTLGPATEEKYAESFVDDNIGKLPLVESVRRRTVEDLLRMDRDAFVGWLTTGSKEDWAARVGTISLPVLIMAGTKESALGTDAQRRHTLPHFYDAELVALKGGGHLAPLERPGELVERITAFVESCHLQLESPSTKLDAEFLALVDSGRTSPQTRTVLKQRLVTGERASGQSVFTQEEFFTLRSLASRIVPGCPFDIAFRVTQALTVPLHDGWRHDSLPADADAWRTGLRSLDAAALRNHGVPFVALDSVRQEELLAAARDGDLGKGLLGSLDLGPDAMLFTAAQMSDWFGDLCAELVKNYVADPRVMQQIGFTGFADEQGFSLVRLNEREDFER